MGALSLPFSISVGLHSAGRWTTEATRTHAATRASASRTAGAAWAAHATMGILSAEEVQTIDHVQHGVRVDAIVPRVAALHGGDAAAEITLVVEYVIELQRDRERLAT